MLAFVKKLGPWAIAYIIVKWSLVAGAAVWLTQFAWFRLEFLLVLPLLGAIALTARHLTKRRAANRDQNLSDTNQKELGET